MTLSVSAATLYLRESRRRLFNRRWKARTTHRQTYTTVSIVTVSPLNVCDILRWRRFTPVVLRQGVFHSLLLDGGELTDASNDKL